MSFSVIKMSPELVRPWGPTPSGSLPLSLNESNPLLMFFGEMVLVFSHGGEEPPAKVIREALARALVPYYPVAGRIGVVVVDTGDDSRLQVAGTGEGAWFVEASAECSLAEIDYIVEQPHSVPRVQLLPCPPPGIHQNAASFMMQVTEFKCGGFVVGIKYNHAMFDGMGVGQFMVAIGEMARGLPHPTIKPVWCRELVPRLSSHPKEPPPPPPIPVEPLTAFSFENCTIDISLDSINELKNQFTKETGGRSCSAFDVVTAKLWQSRTRAINLNPNAVVYFFYPANVRKEFEMLPSEGLGYYGNCVFPVEIEAPSEWIVNASLAEIVSLVKESKESLSAKLSRFLKGDDQGEHEKPIALVSPYETMAVTDFRRIGVFEIDYGWGPPDHVISPLIDDAPAIIGGCTILNSPAPKKGVRLMTSCVVKEHLEAFREEMKKWAE